MVLLLDEISKKNINNSSVKSSTNTKFSKNESLGSKAKANNLKFSTKAGTLNLLQEHLTSANIKPIVSFSLETWKKDHKACIKKITQKLGSQLLIVRSSCSSEDSLIASNAGAFLSIPNVKLSNLQFSIEKVFASYDSCNDEDEILIQPMLNNVVLSGVAFSHDPNTSSPYRIINWHEGNDASAVTSGIDGRIWQQAALSKAPTPPQLEPIINLIKELLWLFDDIPVDCEFAVTSEQGERVVWLLQARPLILKEDSISEEEQFSVLSDVADQVAGAMQAHPFLIGKKTIFGVMPDWNPAEVIGVRPKPLALSLYRDLVTDSIWAYQRHNYGYRNLRSFPLMTHFFGLPFINVRTSFNSFIPEALDENLAGRLVDYYIDRLLKSPSLHDKVEFEIVFSCFTLDLPHQLTKLQNVGFSSTEQNIIASNLRDITNRIIHPTKGLWQEDAAKLSILKSRRDKLYSSSMDLSGQIYWLLEDAKRYGTLPFAGLARAGFIAVQMLKSLVNVGIFSQNDYNNFLESVNTVNKQITQDRLKLGRAEFLEVYGHLRPGTYDILVPRYDEAPDLYFNWEHQPRDIQSSEEFIPTAAQLKDIGALLESHKLEIDPKALINFIRACIELREFSKFEFTKNLSDALSLIKKLGFKYNFTPEEMAFCEINVIKETHISSGNHREALLRSIEDGRNRYQKTSNLAMPPIIKCPEDVWSFEVPLAMPNFITQKQVTAAVASSFAKQELKGKIICIPNADPGFDWVFSYNVAGLITAWGGTNSHMAIRSGELGLPAVIGAGELLYNRWTAAKVLHIDCAGKRVEVL